jgi:hypothetical protein
MTIPNLRSPKTYRVLIPRLILSIALLIILLQGFTDINQFSSYKKSLSLWGSIIGVIALVPTQLVLFRANISRIITKYRKKEMDNVLLRSTLTIISFIFFFYMAYRTPEGLNDPIYGYLFYTTILVVIEGVGYGMMTAYNISEAYMTMKIVSWEAASYIVPAMLYLLSAMPSLLEAMGPQAGDGLFYFGIWIIDTLQMGGTKGALIASTVTAIFLALRSLILKDERIIQEI